MKVDLALHNAMVVTPESTFRANIGIRDGLTAAIAGEPFEAAETINLAGKFVLPGLIDAHTHFRDPGYPELEDFESGTRAAARGGITAVFEMPTALPPVASVQTLQDRAQAIQPRALVDFALYAGASFTNRDEFEGMREAGAIAFKTRVRTPPPGREKPWAGQWVKDDGELFAVFQSVSKTGLHICFHAENWQIASYLQQDLEKRGALTPETVASSYPSVVEADHVHRALLIAQETGARISFCHLTTAAAIAMVKRAKDEGQDVEAEVCFKALFFKTSDVKQYGAFLPTRVPTDEDSAAVWRSLTDGTIDRIASDHSPRRPEEIDAMWRRPGEKGFGVAGTELLVPLLLRHVTGGRLSLSDVARLMSQGPARSFGLYPRKGVIRVGSDADFTVVDMEKTGAIRSSELETKIKYSVLEGEPLVGLPIMTIVRGRVVARDGIVIGTAGHGEWLRPN